MGATDDGKRPADFLLVGEFSRSSNKVVASIRLNEFEHGVTVFAKKFEAEAEAVKDLPERIGAQMAGNLTWAYPLMVMDRRRPIDPSLIADLLQGTDFTGDLLQGYQNSRRVVSKAPDVVAGQTSLAFGTAFVLDELPKSERTQAVSDARRAADRGVAMKPDFGDTYASWCGLHSEVLRAECEDQIRAGKKVDPDAPFLNTILGHLMRDVGRFEEAMNLARLSYSHDLYVPTKIGWMLRSLEYDGDHDGARKLYEQAVRWWPEYQVMFAQNRLFGLLNRANFAEMQRVEREIGAGNLPPIFGTTDAMLLALKSKSPAAAREACRQRERLVANMRCLLGLATVGDLDAAYGVASELYPRRVGRTPEETERIWLDRPSVPAAEFITSPGAAALRKDPRYLELAERVGLLAYWRTGRRPDFCRTSPEPICRQIYR